MTTQALVLLLQIAGLLHVILIWAGASMPGTVNLGSHLAALPPFIRRLFYVYYSFIGLMLVGFGSLTFFFAADLAVGNALGRAFCCLLIAFWTLRLIAAAFIFDVRPYLKTWFHRLGYHSINVIFLYLLIVYVLAGLKGGRL